MKRLLFIIVHAVAFLAGHAQDSIYAVNDVNYAVYTTPSHSTTPITCEDETYDGRAELTDDDAADVSDINAPLNHILSKQVTDDK